MKAPVYSLNKRRLRHAKALLSTLVVACVLAQSPLRAHDPTGQWASLGSDMREWFKSLRSGSPGTPCCEEADGEHVADVDWDTQQGTTGETHYRVYLLGAWREVPEAAVIPEPNRYGPAVVWPVYSRGVSGEM
jgi:hypothetical protein